MLFMKPDSDEYEGNKCYRQQMTKKESQTRFMGSRQLLYIPVARDIKYLCDSLIL
jgi:hypothetical protein